MYKFKPLAREAIPAALDKAERYRLLNEPHDAESICRDVLAINPEDQRALIIFILALTDQFESEIAGRFQESRDYVARLNSEYEREYYSGIISERRAKSIHRRGMPGSGSVAYEWFLKAMASYERAEELRPEKNDDAMLRWNTCARIITENPRIKPEEQTATPVDLE